MSSPILEIGRPSINPLDIVEQMVIAKSWPFERPSGEDLAVEILGDWCAYQLWFALRTDIWALHFSCAFDVKIPASRREPVYPLLGKINEKLWLGHFDLWSEEGQPIFRHAMLFRDSPGPTPAQIEDLVDIAITECERFYPAFQHVLWGGKSAEEAIAAALIDTVGEA